MFSSWISFWTVYFIGGYILNNYDKSIILPGNNLSLRDIYVSLLINCLLSFLCIPISNNIPTLFIVPNNGYGYIIRWILGLVIGDIILYVSHRLLHHPKLYRFHKQHHIYTSPHVLAGLYAHPIEYIFSNHLSMIIPLKIISNQELIMLESAVVALNILISHSGKDSTYARRHTIHHEKNKYNYSFLHLMDRLCGTYM